MRIKTLYVHGRPVEVQHPFEEEVEWLIRTNYRLVLESIERSEKKEVLRLRKEIEDPQEFGSEIAYTESIANDLRRAANELALVSLVTRLQHWINVFVKDLPNAKSDRGLVSNLTTLNDRLGVGFVNVAFFADLVTVRDSIIHADSQIEWYYKGKKRCVPDRYADATTGEVSFREWHLQEAIELSIKQVRWYDKAI